MPRPRGFSLALLLLLGAASFSGALELGLSASIGPSFWNGAWSDSVVSFSEDFGQTASVSFFPACTLYVDAAFSPEKPFHYALAAGIGTWSGRYYSSGGTAPDRTSTVTAWGAEFVPGARYRFRFAHVDFGVEGRLGIGLLLSSMKTAETWSSATVVASYRPQAIDLGYLFAGASLGWFPTPDAFRSALLLSVDAGLASFDSQAGTGSPILMTRVGLGVRVSRGIGTGKKEVGR